MRDNRVQRAIMLLLNNNYIPGNTSSKQTNKNKSSPSILELRKYSTVLNSFIGRS
jgi:hypothetical protein